MSYSSRVFVIAAVLVLLALASYGSAFDVESLLRTAEQKAAYRLAQEHFESDDFDSVATCSHYFCDIPAGNDSCIESYDNGTEVHICTGYNFCNSSSMCEAKYPEGHDCTGSYDECLVENPLFAAQCLWNDTLNKNICSQPKSLGWVGDACSADEECRSGLCNVNATVCEGFQAGDNCTATSECDRDLFCFHAVCTEVALLNSTCTGDDECGINWNGTACIGGRCMTPFAAKKDEFCQPGISETGMFASCASGLYCDPTSNTCKDFTLTECQNDTVCEAFPGTTCACNQFEGKSFCTPSSLVATEKLVKYYDETIKCGKDHGCAIDPRGLCFSQNCIDDLDCFASAFFSGQSKDCLGFDIKCSKDSGSSSEDHHSSADASRNSAAIVITALAVVAALL